MPMIRDRKQLFDAALQLTEADRLILANQLLETLPDDLPGLNSDDPQFMDELLRRSGDMEGSAAWEELRDELPAGQ